MSATLFVAGLLSAVGKSWATDHHIVLNQSHSLPGTLYYASAGLHYRLGQEVAFVPPHSPLVAAHFGDTVLFIKKVLGTAGEVVSRSPTNIVYVGSRIVGRMKPKTFRGEILAPGPLGRIPPDCIYAGSLHPDGFDSRYAAIGFVCRGAIVGGARRIL